jgi:hypothetical protein
VAPISPIKPITPGAIAPVVPGAVAPAKPAAPLAPVPQTKSGTSVIKTAPPKETARITVKPSLPASATPSVKPVAVPAGEAAAVGAAAGAVAVKAGEAKPKVVATAPAAVPVPAMRFPEESEASTLYTTIAAGALAVLTWGTALLLAYYSLSS